MRRAAILLGFLALFLIGATYFPSDDLVIFRGGIRAPIQDKGGQVHHVKSYGAHCDGVTDDITAIQRAENKADDTPGGTVLIPSGTCVISSSILVSSGVTIAGSGWGSVIKANSSLSGVPMILSETEPATDGERDDHITIRNLTLDGSSAASSTNSPCITLRAVVDALVENVNCISPEGDCVTISRVGNDVFGLRNTVQNLFCYSPDRNGVAITGGTGIVIANSQFEDGAYHAIDVELSSISTLAVSRLSIIGNTIEDFDVAASYSGVALNLDTAGQVIRDVSVIGNTITNTGWGISYRGTTDLTISGNTIRGTTDVGINAVQSATIHPENTTIVGNTIVDAGTNGIEYAQDNSVLIAGNLVENAGTHGIRVDDSIGSSVTGNVVKTAGTDCIILSDTADVSVSGNSLTGCGDDGIEIAGTTNNTGIVISGNRVDATNICVGEAVGSNADYNILSNNDARGCTTAVSVVGANTIAYGNLGRAGDILSRGAATSNVTCAAATNGTLFFDTDLALWCYCKGASAVYCKVEDTTSCGTSTSCN